MKNLIYLLTTLAFLTACNSSHEKKDMNSAADQSFDRYKNNFIEDLWKLYPGWASSVGYHKYDSVLVIPSMAFHQMEISFAKAHLDSLKSFHAEELSANNRTDYSMIENALKGIEWGVNDMKDFQWNPASWNVGGGFGEMLNGTYDVLENRLRNMYKRMDNVSTYYEVAKKNIINPTAEHTQLGIDQNLGSVDIFEKDFPDSVNACSKIPDAEKADMIKRSKVCAESIRDYANWLKNLKNPSPRSFRLGKELYAKKFEYDIQSGYTPETIYQKALERKSILHQEMMKITTQLWKKYFDAKAMPSDSLVAIKMMIDNLSAKHVHRDSFQLAIEKIGRAHV